MTLRDLRKARGATLQEVASQCYMTPAALSYYERGEACPGLVALLDLATYYKTTVDEIAKCFCEGYFKKSERK